MDLSAVGGLDGSAMPGPGAVDRTPGAGQPLRPASASRTWCSKSRSGSANGVGPELSEDLQAHRAEHRRPEPHGPTEDRGVHRRRRGRPAPAQVGAQRHEGRAPAAGPSTMSPRRTPSSTRSTSSRTTRVPGSVVRSGASYPGPGCRTAARSGPARAGPRRAPPSRRPGSACPSPTARRRPSRPRRPRRRAGVGVDEQQGQQVVAVGDVAVDRRRHHAEVAGHRRAATALRPRARPGAGARSRGRGPSRRRGGRPVLLGSSHHRRTEPRAVLLTRSRRRRILGTTESTALF